MRFGEFPDHGPGEFRTVTKAAKPPTVRRPTDAAQRETAGSYSFAESQMTTPTEMAKKRRIPMIIPKFTLVVRLLTFTSGIPELSFSMDMRPPWIPESVLGSRNVQDRELATAPTPDTPPLAPPFARVHRSAATPTS